MRLSGFASGLDIDTMVKTLMKAHQAPVTKLQQQSTKIEWQQEAYRSVSTSLVDLRNNMLSSYLLSSAINAKKAEVTGNTTAVSATTQSNTTAGVYSVTVLDLATASSIGTTTAIKGEDANKTFSELNITGLTGKVNIGGTDVEYDPQNDTIESLVSKINQHKGANVTALYNATDGQVSITSRTTGQREITLGGDFDKILNSPVTNLSVGQNAKATIIGITMESTNNLITVNGLNIQLKSESLNNTSTINVTTDTDKVMDTIKSFIKDYNNVLDTVNSKLNEDKYRTYLPLTDEEKEAMSEKQVELWESKAKSGLLKNDTILSSLASSMREAVIAEYGKGSKFNIQSVGISTGKWEDRGKLVIENEDALKRAIEADPERVINLFTAKRSGETPEDVNSTTDYEAGIFTRLSNILMDSIVKLSDKAGTSRTSMATTGSFLESSLLSSQKRDITKKITDLDARLLRIENQYYKQFTAMETAINKYNSQAGSIASYSAF